MMSKPAVTLSPSLVHQGGSLPLSKAGNQVWAGPLAALTSGLRNMGLSQFRAKELLLLENELQVWGSMEGA